MVCRLWGAMANLPCPHGCTVPDDRLTDGAGLDLLAASLQAGGAPAGFDDLPPGLGQLLDDDPAVGQLVRGLIQRGR